MADYEITAIRPSPASMREIADLAHAGPRWGQPTSIRLSDPTLARLDAHAKSRGVSRSVLVQEILAAWLESAGEPGRMQRSLW